MDANAGETLIEPNNNDPMRTPTPAERSVIEPTYTMSEVACHCDCDSCWIVIDDQVYDVTEFLQKHPGGIDIIMEHAGRDCTVPFTEKGHSQIARTLLSTFKIGWLVEVFCAVPYKLHGAELDFHKTCDSFLT